MQLLELVKETEAPRNTEPDMSEVHTRSLNLKTALSYEDWENIAAATDLAHRALVHKGKLDQADTYKTLTRNITEILSALRAEGNV